MLLKYFVYVLSDTYGVFKMEMFSNLLEVLATRQV